MNRVMFVASHEHGPFAFDAIHRQRVAVGKIGAPKWPLLLSPAAPGLVRRGSIATQDLTQLEFIDVERCDQIPPATMTGPLGIEQSTGDQFPRDAHLSQRNDDRLQFRGRRS